MQGTNLTHRFASVHNKTMLLHKNTGKTSMMGNIPAELLYMLTMQQILQRKEAHLDASLNGYGINKYP
jgi:hypothetical protein